MSNVSISDLHGCQTSAPVAKALNMSRATLHLYLKVGKLPPATEMTASNARLFSPEGVEDAKTILRGEK